MILIAAASIAICLAFQAFFAGSEMAIISCNRIKLRHKSERGNGRARLVQRFLGEPEKFLGTTLVGYNVAVVIGSCLLNSIMARANLPQGTENIAATLVLLPLVLVIGQIVPMAAGRQNASRVSLAVARPLRAASLALAPLVFTASLLACGISRLITGRRPRRNPFVTREELELLIKESHASGLLKRDEREMIKEIFEFAETTARDVMVPLVDIVAAPEDASASDIVDLIASSGHTRIPIYRGNIDGIVGTVNATDLAGVPGERPVKDLMRSPYIIPEAASIESILGELRRNRKHIAIVVDEYGGVAGLLTLEDIIEEIIGEIEDEYDREAAPEWEGKRGLIIVDGRMRIEDFNRQFGHNLPVEEVETIGGFVTKRLGSIASAGETVTYGNLTFCIREASERRILSVEVKGVKS